MLLSLAVALSYTAYHHATSVLLTLPWQLQTTSRHTASQRMSLLLLRWEEDLVEEKQKLEKVQHQEAARKRGDEYFRLVYGDAELTA